MEDKENKRDRLLHMPQEYEQNPAIVQRVLAEAAAKKAAPKKSWFMAHWKKIAVSAASVTLAVGIFLPVYFSLQKPPQAAIVYYEPTSITLDTVSDLDAFVEENRIETKYFSYPTVQNQCAKVTASGEIAYLMQDMAYMSSIGFDVVNMKAVVLQNSEFDFEKDFVRTDQECKVGEIIVNYLYTAEEMNSQITVFAKFAYENVKYYLQIETANTADGALEEYVTLLIG